MRRRLLTEVARHAGAAAAVLAFGAVPACADFEPLAQHACGNAVIDRGEDCDTFSSEKDTRCAAAGTVNECRFVCDVGGAVCPAGWGCGHDRVCRKPSGTFAKLGDLVPFVSPHALRSGDLDGDGVPDILLLGDEDSHGLTTARIVYPPTQAIPAVVEPLPLEIATPAFGDIDADGVADLAFGRPAGVTVIEGRKDRDIEYRAFPTFIPPNGTSLREISVDVSSDQPGDELLLLLDQPGVGASLLDNAGHTLVTLPAGDDALSGPLVLASFDESAACPQIVFPYTGASQVWLFTPCRSVLGSVEPNEGGALTAVTLPGVPVDGAVMAVDLDLDHHVDLLISAGGKVFVAWGQGDGTFVSAKINGKTGMAGPYALPNVLKDVPTFPLAAADLNQDGTIDFVFPIGLVISGPGGYASSYENQGTPWTQAAILDMNGDGRPDVAAGSSSALDIDFLLNAGGGFFNPSVLPTSGPTSWFVTGDFDGDLVDDLAFSQSLDNPAGLEDDLSIAFGGSHGAPGEVAIMARLGEVQQIAPAHLADQGAVDKIVDLAVVAQDASTKTDQAFTFAGGGSRTLTSPLPIIDGIPVAIAAGSYATLAPALAVVGAGKGGVLRLYHVELNGSLSPANLMPSDPLSPGFHAAKGNGTNFLYAAFAAAGDLDENGRDEVVFVAPYGTAPDGAALLMMRLDTQKQIFVPMGAEQQFSAALSEDSSLRLMDVDGDGHVDAVLTTGQSENPSDLLVFWNNGTGGLDTTSPGRIQMEGGVADVACLPASNGRGCKLVLVSAKGAWTASVNEARQFDVEAINDMVPGRGVVAGDFDRDGVVDLAVQTLGGLQFYRSVPENE